MTPSTKANAPMDGYVYTQNPISSRDQSNPQNIILISAVINAPTTGPPGTSYSILMGFSQTLSLPYTTRLIAGTGGFDPTVDTGPPMGLNFGYYIRYSYATTTTTGTGTAPLSGCRLFIIESRKYTRFGALLDPSVITNNKLLITYNIGDSTVTYYDSSTGTGSAALKYTTVRPTTTISPLLFSYGNIFLSPGTSVENFRFGIEPANQHAVVAGKSSLYGLLGGKRKLKLGYKKRKGSRQIGGGKQKRKTKKLKRESSTK